MEEVVVTARLKKPDYEKVLKRQRDIETSTGIKPSVGAVVRAMINEAAANDITRKRRVATAR